MKIAFGGKTRGCHSLYHIKSKKHLELIHRSRPIPYWVGFFYFVYFIDDYSRKAWLYIYGLKRKSVVLKTFKKFKSYAKNDKGSKIKCLCSNNKGKYCSRELDEFYSEHGIKRHLTIPDTSQQNGVAERLNRTLMERVYSNLSTLKLDKIYLAKAVRMVCYLINQALTKSLRMEIIEEV